MSKNKISITVRKNPQLERLIGDFPRRFRGVATEAIADYLIGNKTHGLKHYPVYKYIRRRKAYGKTFVSHKQRRFVMARIRDGRIDPGAPHRTGKIQRGWKKTGSGVNTRIVNNERGVEFVMGSDKQARLNAMAGWRTDSKVIEDNMQGALRHANAEINKIITG